MSPVVVGHAGLALLQMVAAGAPVDALDWLMDASSTDWTPAGAAERGIGGYADCVLTFLLAWVGVSCVRGDAAAAGWLCSCGAFAIAKFVSAIVLTLIWSHTGCLVAVSHALALPGLLHLVWT